MQNPGGRNGEMLENSADDPLIIEESVVIPENTASRDDSQHQPSLSTRP